MTFILTFCFHLWIILFMPNTNFFLSSRWWLPPLLLLHYCSFICDAHFYEISKSLKWKPQKCHMFHRWSNKCKHFSFFRDLLHLFMCHCDLLQNINAFIVLFFCPFAFFFPIWYILHDDSLSNFSEFIKFPDIWYCKDFRMLEHPFRFEQWNSTEVFCWCEHRERWIKVTLYEVLPCCGAN